MLGSWGWPTSEQPEVGQLSGSLAFGKVHCCQLPIGLPYYPSTSPSSTLSYVHFLPAMLPVAHAAHCHHWSTCRWSTLVEAFLEATAAGGTHEGFWAGRWGASRTVVRPQGCCSLDMPLITLLDFKMENYDQIAHPGPGSPCACSVIDHSHYSSMSAMEYTCTTN